MEQHFHISAGSYVRICGQSPKEMESVVCTVHAIFLLKLKTSSPIPISFSCFRGHTVLCKAKESPRLSDQTSRWPTFLLCISYRNYFPHATSALFGHFGVCLAKDIDRLYTLRLLKVSPQYTSYIVNIVYEWKRYNRKVVKSVQFVLGGREMCPKFFRNLFCSMNCTYWSKFRNKFTAHGFLLDKNYFIFYAMSLKKKAEHILCRRKGVQQGKCHCFGKSAVKIDPRTSAMMQRHSFLEIVNKRSFPQVKRTIYTYSVLKNWFKF